MPSPDSKNQKADAGQPAATDSPRFETLTGTTDPLPPPELETPHEETIRKLNEFAPGPFLGVPGPFLGGGGLIVAPDVEMAVGRLRTELLAEIGKLRAELGNAPQLSGELLMAPTRSIVYCPKCGIMLDGGSNTSNSKMPYTHPSGSAMGNKTCDLSGREFEKPTVFLKLLPDKRKKPATATVAVTA